MGMNYQQLVSSAVVAAVVSGLVGYLSTRATLRANRARDRFDRLFPLLRAIRSRLHELQISLVRTFHEAEKGNDAGNSEIVVENIIKIGSLHDEVALLYVSDKSLFDKDIRSHINTTFANLLSAEGSRPRDPTAPTALTAYGEALEMKEKFIREFIRLTEEQLTRLQDF